MAVDETELTPEEKEQLKAIRQRKKIIVAAHRAKKGTAGRRPVVPRRADRERSSTISNFRVGPPSVQLAPGLVFSAPSPRKGLVSLGGSSLNGSSFSWGFSEWEFSEWNCFKFGLFEWELFEWELFDNSFVHSKHFASRIFEREVCCIF